MYIFVHMHVYLYCNMCLQCTHVYLCFLYILFVFFQNRSWRFMIFHQPPTFKHGQPPRPWNKQRPSFPNLGSERRMRRTGMRTACQLRMSKKDRDVVCFSEKVQDQSCWRNGNTMFVFESRLIQHISFYDLFWKVKYKLLPWTNIIFLKMRGLGRWSFPFEMVRFQVSNEKVPGCLG